MEKRNEFHRNDLRGLFSGDMISSPSKHSMKYYPSSLENDDDYGSLLAATQTSDPEWDLETSCSFQHADHCPRAPKNVPPCSCQQQLHSPSAHSHLASDRTLYKNDHYNYDASKSSDSKSSLSCKHQRKPKAEAESLSHLRKSQRDGKSLISTKTGSEIRKIVRSQVEFQELKDLLIEKMNGFNNKLIYGSKGFPGSTKNPLELSFSNSLSNLNSVSTQTVSIPGPASSLMSEEPNCMSDVDDIVLSKVVQPLIERVQRLYVFNLREEIDLLKELENMPRLIGEIYKKASEDIYIS